MNSVEIEEDTILYKMHNEASKRGRTVLSLRASEVVDFSSQYGSNDSISYSAENIVGPPTIYPQTGDNAYSYQLRTYGEWWHNLPSCRKSKVNLPHNTAVESQDFIEFRVEKPVVPLLIRIYEVYNPGAIVKILCYCYKPERWVVLWQGKPQYLSSSESNCFTVEAEGIDFVTDHYRIEFHHKHLNYFCEIDGLILYGEEKLPQYFPITFNLSSHLSYSNKLITSSSDTETLTSSKEGTPISSSYFDTLPYEVVQLILSHLDLQSLCMASRVCRLFHKLFYDPMLYRDLNLQLYWHMVDVKTLKSLQSRLASIKNLNLSWCGGQGRITPSYFTEFVEMTCRFLASLKLANCHFVNNTCLKAISHHCPYLKELTLSNCRAKDLTQTGFMCIANMENVTYLDLYRTTIDQTSTIIILKSLRLEHLHLGNCTNINGIDDVARSIGKHLNHTLKTLDLWRAADLTCLGMHEIAKHCNHLVELDLGWCYQVDASCGCIRHLITNCPKLRKLFLTAIRTVSTNEVNAIANRCPDIEQLDILGTTEVSLGALKNLLQCCKKLRLLDVSYCDEEVKGNVSDLEASFPNVKIKCSSPINFVY